MIQEMNHFEAQLASTYLENSDSNTLTYKPAVENRTPDWVL